MNVSKLGMVGVVSVLVAVVSACGSDKPRGAPELDGAITGDGSVDVDGGLEVDGGGGDVDGGVDAGPPEACPTAGAIESVPCGMCGTVDRFCTAELTWAYGTCEGESGVCMPGTTSSESCGMCGSRPTRCTAACTWESAGECGGEGSCAPGTRTRSGAGCGAGETRELLCSDTCSFEPVSACMADACPTPGALEQEPCGMCGTRDRFCNASRVWEYGTCTGEGVCMPGTTGSESCGMCGTQTTRCTDTCTWATFGACTGEGGCMPGTTTRTGAGCAAGQTRVLRCDAACGYTEEVSPCSSARNVDVTLLLEQAGSNSPAVTADLPTITTRCIMPLLALSGVNVGVSYFADFPVATYGGTGDRPFEGGIEPTGSASAIAAELMSRPSFGGSDAPEATVEALSVLAGGALPSTAAGLSCSVGRAAGGCWRSSAARVVVVHTDSPIHNGPDPAGPGLYSPYTGITPAPAQWPAVRDALRTSDTTVVFLDSDASSPAPSQYDEMLTDLGQPLSDHHYTATSTDVGTACDAIVARVRAIAGL
jgi:hypothetical protein